MVRFSARVYVLVEHDGLGGIDDHKEKQHAEEIKLELLVRLKGVLTI